MSATVRGFEWKLIGLNARFANYGGVRIRANVIAVMLTSGAIAGLAGAEQVLGVYGAYYDNFSPGYGFDGIAVAMLANSNPIGVILSSFMFGALNSGSSVLQMQLGMSKYLVQVLQFLVVLILAAQFTFSWRRRSAAVAETSPAATLPASLPAEQGTARRLDAMLSDIAFSSIRIATPLIFAALGGLYTFQAGILNIALDGFMIVAAFAAVAAAYATGSLVGRRPRRRRVVSRACRSSRAVQSSLPRAHLYRRHRGDFPRLRPHRAAAQERARAGWRVHLSRTSRCFRRSASRFLRTRRSSDRC